MTFKTFDIPQSTRIMNVSDEDIVKIKKRVSKINTHLKKEMIKITRKEHRAWKNSHNIRN